MEIVDKPNLYDIGNAWPMIISVSIFILQSVISLIDTNMYVKDVGITDMTSSIVSKARFYMSYVSGYITYVLKTAVSLFGIWVLLTVIRASIVVIFNLVKPIGEGAKLAQEFQGTIFYKLKVSFKSNAMFVLGMFFIEKFFVKFLVYGILIMLLSLVGIAFFLYERKQLLNMMDDGELEKTQHILNTLHHHMMFYMVCIVFIIISSVVRTYTRTFDNLNPS